MILWRTVRFEICAKRTTTPRNSFSACCDCVTMHLEVAEKCTLRPPHHSRGSVAGLIYSRGGPSNLSICLAPSSSSRNCERWVITDLLSLRARLVLLPRPPAHKLLPRAGTENRTRKSVRTSVLYSRFVCTFCLQARIEGMEPLLDGFKTAVMVFRVKGHNLLDYHSNRFDRDFVTFNVRRAATRSVESTIR